MGMEHATFSWFSCVEAVAGPPASSEPDTEGCQKSQTSSFSNTNTWSSHPRPMCLLSTFLCPELFQRRNRLSNELYSSDGHGSYGEREKKGKSGLAEWSLRISVASFCDEKPGFLAKN